MLKYITNLEFEKKITFILPTTGRLSILKTIDSLKNLKNKNWNCIIIFDGVKNNISSKIKDERFTVLEIEKTGIRNNSGLVRNIAFEYVMTNWIGFIDDDDTLSPYYIDYLEEEIDFYNGDIDCIIFRMIYKNLKILPDENKLDIIKGNVGISFCINRKIIDNNIKFENNDFEDYLILNNIKLNNYKISISPHVAYFVNSTPLPQLSNLNLSRKLIENNFEENIINNNLSGYIIQNNNDNEN